MQYKTVFEKNGYRLSEWCFVQSPLTSKQDLYLKDNWVDFTQWIFIFYIYVERGFKHKKYVYGIKADMNS